MNRPTANFFTARPVCVIELPLKDSARILHPEQVILKIGRKYVDIGALCYSLRSNIMRKPGQPTEVVLSSFLKSRPKLILQAIKAISALGNRPTTVLSTAHYFKRLMDWADASGHPDCLAGGDATQRAFRAYVSDVEDRYRRHRLGAAHGHNLQKAARDMLHAITDAEDIDRGVRIIQVRTALNNGTEPAADHDFGHMLALSEKLFDGLCDLVLKHMPFPFKLEMPASLGWAQHHLWLFPTTLWRLPPHQWGSEREKLGRPYWANDYQNGRLADVEVILHRYKGKRKCDQRHNATQLVGVAKRQIAEGNADERYHIRVMLGMIAHNAFSFLFVANTGANLAVAREIETDGELNVAVANQSYREIKFRASGKIIPVIVPVSFMPHLRRFMELRAWLLNGASCPYLFFTFGKGRAKPIPGQASESILSNHYYAARRIDPKLPPIRARKARATMDDWLLRNHEAKIAAVVMGHTEATELKKYGRGSVVDHRDDMTVFLKKVSSTAKQQKVIRVREELGKETKALEQGGCCAQYGHPDGMSDDPQLQPDCAGGCWFCSHRMLVADETDARKVASAAFVMEQLILGAAHELALRPLIAKCEADLESIARTGNCGVMVERIKKEVYEDGGLTGC